ncbi:MAG: recombinase family protein [Hydrogenophaga sp.]|nr:recombinase family protein [Hydrogenophaga sp.]
MTPKPTKKAYSYVRFSTPEQSKGDSLRRQTDLAQKYANQHGLTLDTELTLRDMGISAFRGANVETGALGAFLDAVKNGQVPKGSILLVENLDRLSRGKVLDALTVFTSIINAEIEIVTLMDGVRYSVESLNANMSQLMMAIAFYAMANEESAKKGIRVSAAWQAKRRAAATSGAIMTKKTPYWVETDQHRTKFTLNKERTAVVKLIIELAEKGTGNNSIAKHLHEKGVKGWNPKGIWATSYIQKILQNPALYGGIDIGGDIRDGYYPPVITYEKWSLLQSMRSARRTTLVANRKGALVTNLFSGLLKCGYCGGPMTVAGYKSLASGYDRKYFACHHARTGAAKCKMKMWFIDELEPVLLFWLTKVDYRRIVGHSDVSNLQIEQERLAGLGHRAQENERKIKNVTEAIEEGAKGMVKRLSELDAESVELAASLERQQKVVDAAASRNAIGATRMSAMVALFKALKHTKEEAEIRVMREQLSAAIHAVTQRITLFPAGRRITGTKDERFIDVEFTNGEIRRIDPDECNPN